MNHLVNYLSWSEQRSKLFYTCPKQYGYRFIESWEGWLPTATKSAQDAYHHNCLVSDLRLVTGNIVHDRCGRVLKRLVGGITSDPATEIAIAEADFDNFLSNSAKLPLTALGSKRKKLIAHLIGKVVPPTLIASERASIPVMMEQFFALPEMVHFAAHPGVLLREFIESEIGPPTNELGVPARLITDCVYQQDDVTWVLDWKTGRPHENHRDKGIVYDAYVRARLKLQPESQVKIRFYYLKTGEAADFEFTHQEREEALWRIGEDFFLLQQKSLDPVVNIAPLSSFPARVDTHCFNCTHRLICPEFKAAGFGFHSASSATVRPIDARMESDLADARKEVAS